MPRNVVFVIFTHQTIQCPRQVFSVTGPNPSHSYLYFECSKLYLTGSSSSDYKSALREEVAELISPFPFCICQSADQSLTTNEGPERSLAIRREAEERDSS